MIEKDLGKIIDGLKKLLKNKGVSYPELSKLTNIPLSSLKKSFAGSDIKFSRMIQIVNSLDMSFEEFMDFIKTEAPVKTFELSVEQEQFFVNHPMVYFFFHKIYRENFLVKNAQKELNLDDKQVWKFLRDLENLNLLEITNFPLIKFKVSGGMILRKEGLLQAFLMDKLLMSFSKHIITAPSINKPVDSPFVRIFYGKVAVKTYERLLESMKELQENMMKEASLDRKIYKHEDLIDISWSLGLANCSIMKLAYENSVTGDISAL